jgi:hypothetical protein
VVPAGCKSDADCATLDTECSVGVCDVEAASCSAAPRNEGLSCGDQSDKCAFNGVCSQGACVETAACDTECSLCSEGTCLPLCGNPFDSVNTGTTIADALYTLRTSVDLEVCGLCVCDVNSNSQITAVDALKLLRSVVRLPETLECPAHNTDQ